jgi:hypothetical protein
VETGVKVSSNFSFIEFVSVKINSQIQICLDFLRMNIDMGVFLCFDVLVDFCQNYLIDRR